MSFEEGAMIEPLAVGVYAARRAGVKVGDKVAVLGVGPIGLVTLQAAKARGATQIIATDLAENRLELAKKLGATEVINAKEKDTVEEIMNLTDGVGVDVVLETAGAVKTIQQTPHIIRPGGMITFVGMATPLKIEYEIITAIIQEANITTVFRYANAYPISIDLVSKGLVDVKSLITHRFTLDQTREALEFSDKNKDISIKSVIIID